MSQENVEMVTRAFAAFEQGDLDQIIDLMSDDLVTHRVDPDDAVYHGKQGFFQATADWTEDFEDWTVVAEVHPRKALAFEAAGLSEQR